MSNSILSPNTYHYSTKVSPTTNMRWDQLAQIPLHKTSEDVVINTLHGIYSSKDETAE